MEKKYVQYGCVLSAPINWLNFDASPTLRIQKIPIIGGLLKNRLNVIFPENVIFGDIIKYHNEMLLNLLNNNFNQINFDFKSHPSTPINLNNYHKLRVRNVNLIKNKYNKII